MRILFYLFFMTLIVTACLTTSTTNSNTPITLTWKLIENKDDGTFSAEFHLTHQLEEALDANNWAIYYNQIVGTPIPSSIGGLVSIERVNGDFWRIAPRETFNVLPANTAWSIPYLGTGAINKEAWGPLTPYLVLNSRKGEEIIPIALEILPFEEPTQINRGSTDRVPIPTPEGDYDAYAQLSKLDRMTLPPVVPTPVYWEYQDSQVAFPEGTIQISGEGRTAEWLQESLGKTLGIASEITTRSEGNITLLIDDLIIEGELHAAGSHAYDLAIQSNGTIIIKGSDKQGLLYGAQSLVQYLTIAQANQWPLTALSIQDYPRYNYRGVHLDVARNFQSAEQVKLLLSVMGAYKLNKLHFHLTDDEGWRIEIPELPELTSIGAFRGHTLDEKKHLYPAYGSGPDPKNPQSAGNGFYTQAEYAAILVHAQKLGIEVIPEIDLPGHARAAIVAMKRRAEQTGDASYLLHDPEDASEYVSVQNYSDNVICPCQESTYTFIETVVRNILGIYKSVGVPLSTLHIGGDEVPSGVWEKSPACAELIAATPSVKNVLDLNYYFVNRMREMLNRYGLNTSGWEEVALERIPNENGGMSYNPHPDFKGGSIIPYVWNNLWGNQDLGNRLANAGYPVVLCGVTNLYLDMAYNKDPQEPGLTWGGFVNTQRVFSFAPEEVFFSTTQDPMGNPFDRASFYSEMEPLEISSRKNILGIQGQLWSETLLYPDRLSYFYFPKLLGLAERAWAAKPAWEKQKNDELLAKDWEIFANAIGQGQLDYIDAAFQGLNYRIPSPGVTLEANTVKVNTAFPGLSVRYEVGNSPNSQSAILTNGTLNYQKGIQIAAFTHHGKQMSKVVYVDDLIHKD